MDDGEVLLVDLISRGALPAEVTVSGGIPTFPGNQSFHPFERLVLLAIRTEKTAELTVGGAKYIEPLASRAITFGLVDDVNTSELRSSDQSIEYSCLSDLAERVQKSEISTPVDVWARFPSVKREALQGPGVESVSEFAGEAPPMLNKCKAQLLSLVEQVVLLLVAGDNLYKVVVADLQSMRVRPIRSVGRTIAEKKELPRRALRHLAKAVNTTDVMRIGSILQLSVVMGARPGFFGGAAKQSRQYSAPDNSPVAHDLTRRSKASRHGFYARERSRPDPEREPLPVLLEVSSVVDEGYSSSSRPDERVVTARRSKSARINLSASSVSHLPKAVQERATQILTRWKSSGGDTEKLQGQSKDLEDLPQRYGMRPRSRSRDDSTSAKRPVSLFEFGELKVRSDSVDSGEPAVADVEPARRGSSLERYQSVQAFWHDRCDLLEKQLHVVEQRLQENVKACRALQQQVDMAEKRNNRGTAVSLIKGLNCDDVQALLREFSLDQYCHRFSEHDINGQKLVGLNERILENNLLVKNRLHRLKILQMTRGNIRLMTMHQ